MAGVPSAPNQQAPSTPVRIACSALQYIANLLSPHSKQQALALLNEAQQQPQQHLLGHEGAIGQAQLQRNPAAPTEALQPLEVPVQSSGQQASQAAAATQPHSLRTQAQAQAQAQTQAQAQQLQLAQMVQPLAMQQQQQQVEGAPNPPLPMGPLCCDDLDWKPSSRKNSSAVVAYIPTDRLNDFLTGEGRAGRCSFWADGQHDRSSQGPPAIVKVNSIKFTADYHCCFGPEDLRQGHSTHKGDAGASCSLVSSCSGFSRRWFSCAGARDGSPCAVLSLKLPSATMQMVFGTARAR